jgi:hypothetical protein
LIHFTSSLSEKYKGGIVILEKHYGMARDFYHEHLKIALERDGWTITHDPFEITVDSVDYEIDFGTEKLIGAEKEGHKIAVEVKSCVGRSTVNEFHKAVGQYNDYFVALEEYHPSRELFLAVPDSVYRTFFQKPVIQKSLRRIEAKIIVYSPIEKNIVAWEM